MSTNTGSFLRWPLILGYVGVLSVILSCTTIGLGSSNIAQGILQLDDGIIKVQDQNGDWEPMAGDSTFELVGTLEGIEPWKVSGRALQTNDATQIAQGLEVGDLVRIRGAVLEDDTWLAYSIEPAAEQMDQTITIIGRVTSVDPWVVNDVTLNVTEDTVITGDIQPGMLVRVEILLLEDGTWEVISISPVGDLTSTDGCVNVIATVVSVSGNQIQFLGWPATVTVDVELPQPGQQVLAVICLSDDGQLVIVQITVLDDDSDTSAGGEKALVCHKPDKKGGHTLSISTSAVPAHLGHGDTLGPCP